MKIRLFSVFVLGAAATALGACSSGSPEADSAAAADTTGQAAKQVEADHGAEHAHEEAPMVEAKDSYPLTTCPITGAELGSMGDPIIETIEGREVRFCCAGCPDKFKANLEENFAKMDAAIVEAQSASYPVDFCLVSGDELGGDHGEIIDLVVDNRLFKVCCKSCISDLEAAPGDFAAMLDKALAGEDVPKPEGSHSDSEHGDDHGDEGHH